MNVIDRPFGEQLATALGTSPGLVEKDRYVRALGVLASLAQPLAEAEIPMFVISTFTTDYVFVMEENLVNAVQALQQAGHTFLHKDT